VHWDHCAIEEVFATAIFSRSGFYSASMLFHALVLVFEIIVAPDRLLNELT
jgi:hypothetical protein